MWGCPYCCSWFSDLQVQGHILLQCWPQCTRRYENSWWFILWWGSTTSWLVVLTHWQLCDYVQFIFLYAALTSCDGECPYGIWEVGLWSNVRCVVILYLLCSMMLWASIIIHCEKWQHHEERTQLLGTRFRSKSYSTILAMTLNVVSHSQCFASLCSMGHVMTL